MNPAMFIAGLIFSGGGCFGLACRNTNVEAIGLSVFRQNRTRPQHAAFSHMDAIPDNASKAGCTAIANMHIAACQAAAANETVLADVAMVSDDAACTQRNVVPKCAKRGNRNIVTDKATFAEGGISGYICLAGDIARKLVSHFFSGFETCCTKSVGIAESRSDDEIKVCWRIK